MKLRASIQRRLGYILLQPNYTLLSAALDPSVFLDEIISPDLNDEIWSLLEIQAREYSDLLVTTMTDDLNPNLSDISFQDIHRVLKSYRSIFEDPAKRERLELTDPLNYWKQQFAQSPQSLILKSLVLCLFCICATSAPSERLFSQCGRVLTKIRCRMLPAHLDELILIKGFIHSPLFDFETLLNTVCEAYVPK